MRTHTAPRAGLLHRRADDEGVALTPVPPEAGTSDAGAHGTCSGFVPLGMRDDEPSSPAAVEQRREMYLESRTAQRRAFAGAWAGLLVLWGAGLALVLGGIDDDSFAGGTAHLLAFMLPLALVVGLPALYVSVRRRGRIDDFEEHPETPAGRGDDPSRPTAGWSAWAPARCR